jgi:carboxypeptidase family protein
MLAGLRVPCCAALLACLAAPAGLAQQRELSTVAGTVVGETGGPIDGVAIRIVRRDDRDSTFREVLTRASGEFEFGGLAAGTYSVSARRLGYRAAERSGVRLAAGQRLTLRISLVQTARQLSAIVVESSPLSIDATTTELATRLDQTAASLLPTARDAASLVALVPGARRDQLWGAAGATANDYRLDGLSFNNPGNGGDFLVLPIDWIDALEVRGLGAGAEYGNFQGGVIDAVTKTGTNELRGTVRTNYESPRLTAKNPNLDEEGAEQAGRRELGGELLGPLLRDRLFFFVAGQGVERDVRAPDLATPAPHDFQPVRESHRDGRGLAKLTWLPAIGDRVDLLIGLTSERADHAMLNGIDDPSAARRDQSLTRYYEATWTRARTARNELDVRIGGFSARQSQLGYAGPNVPAVQLLQLGREPFSQNAAFDERSTPSSAAASVLWRRRGHALSADHELSLGAEVERSGWRDDLTRNGGLTWRPYTTGVSGFDPANAATWQTVGSDWGGDVHIHSDAENDAVFVQEQATLGARLTVSGGLRYGRWTGWLRPGCATTCGPRLMAVRASGLDPRVGMVWDVTGRRELAIKAHVGRYHQGMFPLFFDRVSGADVYSNERFYYLAPPFTDGRTTYTSAQRDSLTGTGGFSTYYNETILNESGPVEHYRQPYVDQLVLSAEKAFGSGWKADLVYTHRKNGDIVGLVDRNLATNYTAVHDIQVEHRLAFGTILDANGRPLVLPVVYVANDDLLRALAAQYPGHGLAIIGVTPIDPSRLRWNPDVVFTSIPSARREYDQLTLTVHALHARWRGDGSVTLAHLRGNVAGVTGYGAAGTQFSAGPFVRPNEGINDWGALPGAMQLEAKFWGTARLSRSLSAGLVYTHILGERFTPTFQLDGRYRYVQSDGSVLPDELFTRVLGQTIFVEPRGSRQYASHSIADAHLEWTGLDRLLHGAVLTADLFNVTDSHAVIDVKTTIDDQATSDPTSRLGAPRLRVPPRTLRLGLRVE